MQLDKGDTRKYPYFDVAVGLARSYWYDASGSVATGRVSHAGEVKSDDSDKQGYSGPPTWGGRVGRRVDNPTP
jgi:hypothetical protein